MKNNLILNCIDHTLLKPVCTWEQICKLCDEAIEMKTASVCVPPSYVSRIKKKYNNNLKICTVIGFPLGYNTVETKVFEAQDAIKKGADEIDMVINIGDVKAQEFDKITNEIMELREATNNLILKVIIETCYLTNEEMIRLSKCVTDANADFIKTSTGFGTGGAKLEDIALLKKNIGPNVKIKAAGGIRTREDFEAFIEAGCDRIGSSNAKVLL